MTNATGQQMVLSHSPILAWSYMAKPLPGREPDPMAGVVDRLLAQLPGLQSQPEQVRAVPQYGAPFVTVAAPVRVQPATPREWIGVWGRVLLALSLGIMMAGWPYLQTCGLPLLSYLGAVATVTVTGGWAAVAAWKHRISLAHIVSLIVVFYGIMLTTAELLPRSGYAVDHATWQCEEAASAFTAVTT
jgi:hypothetical protein